jgi:uncharacterized protein (DUF2249 family)
MMAYIGRRVYDPSHLRYRVTDDTITTWKIVDDETGREILGLAHQKAVNMADKFNTGQEGWPEGDD